MYSPSGEDIARSIYPVSKCVLALLLIGTKVPFRYRSITLTHGARLPQATGPRNTKLSRRHQNSVAASLGARKPTKSRNNPGGRGVSWLGGRGARGVLFFFFFFFFSSFFSLFSIKRRKSVDPNNCSYSPLAFYAPTAFSIYQCTIY